MKPKEPLTRANIERVVAAVHADAVLTTAVVTVKVGTQEGYTSPYYQVTGVGYADRCFGGTVSRWPSSKLRRQKRSQRSPATFIS